MRKVRITSTLPASYRDELERITYFNPEQERVAEFVVDSVRQFGAPTINEDDGCLRFRVRAFGLVQSLYALDETDGNARLVGVVIFVRESKESILGLHLAVHEDYTANGDRADAWIAPRLMAAVRGIALHTHGVHSLRFLYPHTTQLPLEHRPSDVGQAHSARRTHVA